MPWADRGGQTLPEAERCRSIVLQSPLHPRYSIIASRLRHTADHKSSVDSFDSPRQPPSPVADNLEHQNARRRHTYAAAVERPPTGHAAPASIPKHSRRGYTPIPWTTTWIKREYGDNDDADYTGDEYRQDDDDYEKEEEEEEEAKDTGNYGASRSQPTAMGKRGGSHGPASHPRRSAAPRPSLCSFAFATGEECLRQTHAVNGLCFEHQAPTRGGSGGSAVPTSSLDASAHHPRSPLHRHRRQDRSPHARLTGRLTAIDVTAGGSSRGSVGRSPQAYRSHDEVEGYYGEGKKRDWDVDDEYGEGEGEQNDDQDDEDAVKAFRTDTLLWELLRRSEDVA